ncbi:RNA polymerase II-associated protein 3, partial [Chytriomyces hyalinus]
MLSMDKHTKPTRKPSNSSLETALLVRENAAETRRQMADLLDWEKSIKKKDSTASLASTTAASVPVRGKSSPVANAIAKERIKSGDYRAWDKFDVEQEISRMDAQEESSNNTPAQDQTIRESPQQIEERLEQSLIQKEMGNEYFKKGNYLKAIKSYSKSLEMCGSDASSNASKIAVLGNRAMAHLKLNQFEQAESDCTAVLSLDSKNVKAYWRRAVARRELQTNLSGAKQDLEKAKVLEPTNASVKQELEKLQKILEQAKKPLRRRVDITEVGDPKAYSTTSDLTKTDSPKAVESRVTERMDIQMKT